MVDARFLILDAGVGESMLRSVRLIGVRLFILISKIDMLSRQNLDPNEYDEIEKELPVLDDLTGMILAMSPDIISMSFKPDSHIPIASVCLRDSVNVISEAKFAFREALAHKAWYSNHCDQVDEWVGVYLSRFFLDDAALRLYSSSEHLANAITNMLEIRHDGLNDFRKGNRISHQVLVGNYLLDRHPNHEITIAIKKLIDSDEWKRMVNYRNAWVHSQPPHIEGLGIVYERRKRWVSDNNAHILSFGGGDQPKLKLEELIVFIKESLLLFTGVLSNIVYEYIKILRAAGLQFDRENVNA